VQLRRRVPGYTHERHTVTLIVTHTHIHTHIHTYARKGVHLEEASAQLGFSIQTDRYAPCRHSNTQLSHHYYTIVTSLLHPCYTIVTQFIHCRCNEGYAGDYCSQCTDGYYLDGYHCRACSAAVVSSRCCTHCCYPVVTLSLHCCYTVVTLLSHSCHTVVTLLSHCCHTLVRSTLTIAMAAFFFAVLGILLVSLPGASLAQVVTLLLHCCYTIVTLLSHCPHTVVTTLV
jgi:hypothetical protein